VNSLTEANLQRAFLTTWKVLTAKHPNFGVPTGSRHFDVATSANVQWWKQLVKQTILGASPDGHRTSLNQRNFDEMYEELYNHFATANAWEVFPEARQVVSELKQRGVKIGVLSNFDVRLVRPGPKSPKLPLKPLLAFDNQRPRSFRLL